MPSSQVSKRAPRGCRRSEKQTLNPARIEAAGARLVEVEGTGAGGSIDVGSGSTFWRLERPAGFLGAVAMLESSAVVSSVPSSSASSSSRSALVRFRGRAFLPFGGAVAFAGDFVDALAARDDCLGGAAGAAEDSVVLDSVDNRVLRLFELAVVLAARVSAAAAAAALDDLALGGGGGGGCGSSSSESGGCW